MDTAAVDTIIDRWGRDPHYVIEMLQDIQEAYRHLPQDVLRYLSDEIRVPLRQLYHLGTFFKAFSLEPKGEHEIQVCVGTACHVRGAARVIDAFARELDVEAGKTTEDGKYTLEEVRCLGCCSLAPVVQIDEQITSGANPGDVPRMLEKVDEGVAR